MKVFGKIDIRFEDSYFDETNSEQWSVFFADIIEQAVTSLGIDKRRLPHFPVIFKPRPVGDLQCGNCYFSDSLEKVEIYWMADEFGIEPAVISVIDAIFHEFVHVKQILYRRLRSTHDGFMFDGKFVSDTVAYRDRPFEVEAWRLGPQMTYEFFAPPDVFDGIMVKARNIFFRALHLIGTPSPCGGGDIDSIFAASTWVRN